MELVLLIVLVGVLVVVVGAGLVVGLRRSRPDRSATGDAPEGQLGGSPTGTTTRERDEPALGAPPESDLSDGAPAAPPDATAPLEDAPPVAPPQPVEAPPSLRERFARRLTRTRNALGGSIVELFGGGVTDEAWEGLEEALISADIGVVASVEIVTELRRRAREEGATDPKAVVDLLKQELRAALGSADRSLARTVDDEPTVWLVTGVNGTGKTTSIGKLAAREHRDGHTVVVAAADTFRAAAADQLGIWAERTEARLVRGDESADPASVAFDGYNAARATDADVLMVDTAGRLHNKRTLMDELAKVKRVIEKQAGPLEETLLVLDATTGQNGIAQAQAFTEAVEVTGIVLTKLDGSSKGGIVVAVQRELGIPVKLVGLGEDVDDLADFDPDAFVDGLFTDLEA